VKKKVVNLGKVRASLDRIASRTAKAGSEVSERTESFCAGDLPALEAIVGRYQLTSMYISGGLLKKAKEMVPRMRASEFAAVLGEVTRSDVLRLAVAKGLAVLDDELPAAGTARKKKTAGAKRRKKRG
jgi:hypothetical protein